MAGAGTRERMRGERGVGSARRRAPRASLLPARLVALALALGSTTVAAQSATPAPAAQAEVAPPALPASGAVARAALDSRHRSLLELRQLQLRENELWQLRDTQSLAGPGTGLGLGLVGALTLIPLGSLFLAAGYSSDDSDESYGSEDDTGDGFRIVGGMSIGAGVAALLIAVSCGIRVRQLRPARRAAERELRAIRQRRIRILDTLTLSSGPRHAG